MLFEHDTKGIDEELQYQPGVLQHISLCGDMVAQKLRTTQASAHVQSFEVGHFSEHRRGLRLLQRSTPADRDDDVVQ